MNEKKITINYIFYLQNKDELDHNYHLLADVLSKINISLLPIHPNDLEVIDKTKKHHIISISNDFVSATSFKKACKSFLDSAMNGKRIAVYDISSFSEIENAQKYFLKNAYRHFQLPQNLKQVAMTVAVEYFREKNTTAEWPGGKRSRLPAAFRVT